MNVIVYQICTCVAVESINAYYFDILFIYFDIHFYTDETSCAGKQTRP